METVTITTNTPFRLINRRGTNSERLSCLLAEGELGYTTDTQRMYVGDGITPGGILVNNKFYQIYNMNELSSYKIEKNDLVYVHADKTLYYENNGLIPIKLDGNITFNDYLFERDSTGITLKDVKCNYVKGKIDSIGLDSYGRIIKVNSNYIDNTNTDYYNINTTDTVGDLKVYNNDELVYEYNAIEKINNDNINNGSTWFTYNWSETTLSSILMDYEWVPFLSNEYDSIETQVTKWTGSFNGTTNIIIQPNSERYPDLWNQNNNYSTVVLNNKAINFRAYNVEQPLIKESFNTKLKQIQNG